MLRKWLRHFWDEVRTEKGWQLFFKAFFGCVALIVNAMVLVVAVLTVDALLDQLRSQQWSEALSRGDKIATDLQSDKVWDRIIGLRELQTYPFEFQDVAVAPQASSLAPFELSKSAILLHFERLRLTMTDSGSDRTSTGDQNAIAPNIELPGRFEKSLSLKVLSDLGTAGWYLSRPKRPPRLVASLNTPVQVDMHWIVTDRPSSGPATSDPAEIMSGKDLSGISIVHSDFSCISLSGSRLAGIRGSQIAFFGADMSNIDLSGAQLEYVDIASANARHARFPEAQLIGVSTNVRGNVHETLINDRYDPGAVERCLEGDNTRDQNLTDLTGADFRGAQLRESDFGNSLLGSADFSSAWLDNVTFASPHRKDLTEAQAARFVGAHFFNVSFEGVDLRSAEFAGATFSGVRFNGAILDGASFRGTRIERDDLRKMLTDASSMVGANFADVEVRDDGTVCDLIARKAVFVTDDDSWRARGKPLEDWLNYAKDEMRLKSAACLSGQRTETDGRSTR